MGADNVVVLAFALVVLLVFSAIFVEQMTPMFAKARFDELCRNYLLIAEANNGLTGNQQKKLSTELEEMGLQDIQIRIQARDQIARRGMMDLIVRCKYVYSSIGSLFDRTSKELAFHFERGFLARRIVE